MNYFIENGINENIIKDVYDNLSEKDLVFLEHNSDNFISVYNYLKNIGISEDNIKELLFTDIDIFYMDLDGIKSSIEKYDISKIVPLLNDNIEIFFQIL